MQKEKNPNYHFSHLQRTDPELLRTISIEAGKKRVILGGAEAIAANARAGKARKRIALIDPDGTKTPEEIAAGLRLLEIAQLARMRDLMRQKRQRLAAAARAAEVEA